MLSFPQLRRTSLDIDALSRSVHSLLGHEPPGTMVFVRKDGTVEVLSPGQRPPPFERRHRPAAIFVATSSLPMLSDVRLRIQQGMRKIKLTP